MAAARMGPRSSWSLPGRWAHLVRDDAAYGFMGKSAMNISANDLIWEFLKHPMKE